MNRSEVRARRRSRLWARAEQVVDWLALDPRRRATGFAVAVLCLLLATRLSSVLSLKETGQVPLTVALFVLPFLYAVPGSRRRLDRYCWPVLGVQGALVCLALAVFGSQWQEGIDGLLAGLVLLMVRGRVAWLIAGMLLAAEVAVKITLTGASSVPGWLLALSVVTYYVDDVLLFFGMVRLAQVVGEVEHTRRKAADLAVARTRLQAAESVRVSIGKRLADISAKTLAARRAVSADAAQARALVAAAGTVAREAAARARALTADDDAPLCDEPVEDRHAGAVIANRLAWAVLVATLLSIVLISIGSVVSFDAGTRRTALAIGCIVIASAIQFRHSQAARHASRPRGWPLTLALLVVLVYAFAFPFLWMYAGFLGPFAAGSILLLVHGRWRWVGYFAVVASYSALYAVLPVWGHLFEAHATHFALALNNAGVTAGVGLMVYGLSRLAGLAHHLEALQDQVAQTAAVRERLRVARDVHDLLGLGLSAIALKADLISALLGRDKARAVAELQEMSRICASAKADVRLVTGGGARPSLADELDAAKQILSSAGIEVHADFPRACTSVALDEALAPVLREGVTNVLRHSKAVACVIEFSAEDGVVRLEIRNDGISKQTAPLRSAGDSGGRGLVNLATRMGALGGQLTSHEADGWFVLATQIPPPASLPAPSGRLAHQRDRLRAKQVATFEDGGRSLDDIVVEDAVAN